MFYPLFFFVVCLILSLSLIFLSLKLLVIFLFHFLQTGSTALIQAARHGFSEVMSLLLSSGATMDIEDQV